MYFLFPSPRISHFSKESYFLLLDKWYLGTTILANLWVFNWKSSHKILYFWLLIKILTIWPHWALSHGNVHIELSYSGHLKVITFSNLPHDMPFKQGNLNTQRHLFIDFSSPLGPASTQFCVVLRFSVSSTMDHARVRNLGWILCHRKGWFLSLRLIGPRISEPLMVFKRWNLDRWVICFLTA